jgi:hypothetical protein
MKWSVQSDSGDWPSYQLPEVTQQIDLSIKDMSLSYIPCTVYKYIFSTVNKKEIKVMFNLINKAGSLLTFGVS